MTNINWNSKYSYIVIIVLTVIVGLFFIIVSTQNTVVQTSAKVNMIEPSVVEETADLSTYTPLVGFKIGVDAGHQEFGMYDKEPNGPNSDIMKTKVSGGGMGVNSQTPESVVNLEVALLVEQLIKEYGGEVVMTRTTNDVQISNMERAKYLSNQEVDLSILIHSDSYEDEEVHGATMLVPISNGDEQLELESYIAGEHILNSFILETGAKDRGIVERDDIAAFNWSTVPVCLIEMGYLSNPQEDELLNSKEYQQKCAKGIVDGIVSYAKK